MKREAAKGGAMRPVGAVAVNENGDRGMEKKVSANATGPSS